MNALDEWVPRSPALGEAVAKATAFARTTFPILLLGETGTGKTWLSRVIHDASSRCDGPFVEFVGAAYPDSLHCASALFGHERGAFTGAITTRIGLLEEADGGTFVIHELQDLPHQQRRETLDAWHTGAFRRLGSNFVRRSRFRLLMTSNVGRSVLEAQLGSDFFARVAVLQLELPPLRECRADLPTMGLVSPRLPRGPSRATH